MLDGALLQDRLFALYSDISADTLHTIKSSAYSAWQSNLAPISSRSNWLNMSISSHVQLCHNSGQEADEGLYCIHRSMKSHLQSLLHPVADNGELCMVFGVLQKIIRQPEVPLYITCSSCHKSQQVIASAAHAPNQLQARHAMCTGHERTCSEKRDLCRVGDSAGSNASAVLPLWIGLKALIMT